MSAKEVSFKLSQLTSFNNYDTLLDAHYLQVNGYLNYLPTIISSHSLASLLYFIHKSHVNKVDPLLNTDVSDDIRAASMQANKRPKTK